MWQGVWRKSESSGVKCDSGGIEEGRKWCGMLGCKTGGRNVRSLSVSEMRDGLCPGWDKDREGSS